MCGIAGILKFDGRFTREHVEAVLRMLDVQVPALKLTRNYREAYSLFV